MPFETGAFDFVICRGALQNFSEPVKALQEMRRVLNADGTAVVIDLRRDVSSRALNQYVRKVSTGFRNWLTNQLVFRVILTKRAYSTAQLKQFISASGFRNSDIREGAIFLEMWLVA
jgi:ubiquinone/menaquinone biosynthesis C-methylase UbiE